MEPSANFSGEEGSEGERKQANAGFRSRARSLSSTFSQEQIRPHKPMAMSWM